MANEERDREFKIRPPRPRRVRSDEPQITSLAFRQMMRIARMSTRRGSTTGMLKAGCRFKQRCAVRVTYTRNKLRGQWAAHGRYISRESAAKNNSGEALAFGSTGPVHELAARLDEWQQAGDPRLFKLIIS